jgi:hypothetical protein
MAIEAKSASMRLMQVKDALAVVNQQVAGIEKGLSEKIIRSQSRATDQMAHALGTLERLCSSVFSWTAGLVSGCAALATIVAFIARMPWAYGVTASAITIFAACLALYWWKRTKAQQVQRAVKPK